MVRNMNLLYTVFLDAENEKGIEIVEHAWAIAKPICYALIKVAVIFLIGRKLIRLLTDLIRKGGNKAKLEKGLLSFLTSVTNIVLYVILGIIIAGVVGIPTASLVAVLASCGATIGLALQGSLQNFAGGILILFMKPFIIGDYIVSGSNEGFVIDIDICYTRLRTFDNRIIVLPNGSLANNNLVNFTKEKIRRVDIVVPISYTDDIRTLRKLLIAAAEANEMVITDVKPAVVNVKAFGDSSINLNYWIWCKSENYWKVYFAMMEKVKYIIDESGFTIPFTQVDVKIKQDGAFGPEDGEARRKAIKEAVALTKTEKTE